MFFVVMLKAISSKVLSDSKFLQQTMQLFPPNPGGGGRGGEGGEGREI